MRGRRLEFWQGHIPPLVRQGNHHGPSSLMRIYSLPSILSLSITFESIFPQSACPASIGILSPTRLPTYGRLSSSFRTPLCLLLFCKGFYSSRIYYHAQILDFCCPDDSVCQLLNVGIGIPEGCKLSLETTDIRMSIRYQNYRHFPTCTVNCHQKAFSVSRLVAESRGSFLHNLAVGPQ